MDRRTGLFLAAGLVLALGIAGFSGLFSSGEPDGLERVAIDQDFDDTSTDSALDSPLSDYGVEGIENDGLSTGLAGVIGVAVTLGLTVGILKIVQLRKRQTTGPKA